MEKKFIVINYGVDDARNAEVLRDVIFRLTVYMLLGTQYPFNFRIYSGVGLRGEEGVWLEFGTKESEENKTEV